MRFFALLRMIQSKGLGMTFSTSVIAIPLRREKQSLLLAPISINFRKEEDKKC